MLGWYYRVLEFNFLAFVIYSFICFYYNCFKIISIIRTVLWFDSIFDISTFWHKLTKSWISHYKILHILDGFFNFFVLCDCLQKYKFVPIGVGGIIIFLWFIARGKRQDLCDGDGVCLCLRAPCLVKHDNSQIIWWVNLIYNCKYDNSQCKAWMSFIYDMWIHLLHEHNKPSACCGVQVSFEINRSQRLKTL